MTLRNNLPQEKKEAHKVLDMVRYGVPVANWRIRKALAVQGDV